MKKNTQPSKTKGKASGVRKPAGQTGTRSAKKGSANKASQEPTPTDDNTPLTPKEKQFCEELMIDNNGAAAARRAGYAPRSANVTASQLLSKPNINAYVNSLRTARSKRTEITSDYVLTGLKEVAERCLQRVPVMDWNYEARAFEQKRDEHGNAIWEFDSSGANRAFELLGKHVGVFEKDNSQKGMVINVGLTE